MLQVCRLDGAHPAPHNRFLNQQFESLKRIRIQSTQLTSFQYSRQVSLIGVTLFCQNWAKIGKFILYFSMTYVILEPPPFSARIRKALDFFKSFFFWFHEYCPAFTRRIYSAFYNKAALPAPSSRCITHLMSPFADQHRKARTLYDQIAPAKTKTKPSLIDNLKTIATGVWAYRSI